MLKSFLAALVAVFVVSIVPANSSIHHRYSHHHHARHHGHSGSSGHSLVARSGATASVASAALPHFQCLLGKLEDAGYRVDFMGGYASRGNASAHPTGNALDINQTGRNRVTRQLPSGATAMASSCGLVHGAVWSSPDKGHFELANKVGYVYPTQYASHRAGRARYADATVHALDRTAPQ